MAPLESTAPSPRGFEGGTGCSLGADRTLVQLLPMKTQRPWKKAQCGSDGERGGPRHLPVLSWEVGGCLGEGADWQGWSSGYRGPPEPSCLKGHLS